MISPILEHTLSNINAHPEKTDFKQLIDVINSTYDYAPTTFRNGVGESTLVNEAGTNEGSCRIFSFAKINGLDKNQTLHCFGDYYRKDVLGHPDNSDHGNIRNFIQYGWEGIHFDQEALTLKM